ncbi:MAG: 4-hydroxy-tetrahydrodipicolinate synthase [Firmicutes bacterium]|nr:4-hydroxy-tetrahydrodipicolinate synthase [Bacillota bacterium]
MENNFGPLLTAMVTPLNDKLEVNYDQAAKLATYLLENGSDGIVVAGTTGESPTLTFEEKCELFKTVVAAVKGRGAVIAGTGSYSTKESVKLTIEAEKIGVDGIMLVTPYYNKPPQQSLYLHFKEIASATSLPVMLYNVPGRTGTNMSAETTLRLAEIDNIVAVKEASGSIEQITDICRKAPPGFALYSGADPMTLPILSVGGVGVVSVASQIAGKEIKKMINAYFNGDVQLACRIHQQLFPLFKGIFISSNPIPIKEALNLKGFNVGNPRLPLSPLNAEQKEKLVRVLEELDEVKL